MKRLLSIAGLLCLLPALALAQDTANAPEPADSQPPDAGVGVPGPAPIEPVAATSVAQYEPPPGQAAAEVPMSEAELEALGLNTNQGGVDTSFQLSGFADFSVSGAIVPEHSAWRITSAPPHTTFYVGNFNLYLKKNLTENLRTMGEVRFTYLPNGSSDLLTGATTNTNAADLNDYNRTLRWGGVEIERFYLEWSIHSLVALRVGQFLTPYGVWNVDHGSPTYIPVQRPFVIGNNWFPERQTGFELFGRWDPSADSTIGYHLTLSNGTGPISEYKDLDANKAIGGHLFWEYHGLGELRIGASGYYGRDTDATWSASLKPNGAIGSQEKINAQFDGLAWGADAYWKFHGLHLQTEWITKQVVYTDKGRAATLALPGMPTTFNVDSFSWGMYALAGYRFKWLGTMPFVVLEHIDGTLYSNFYFRNITYQGGLNVRPVDMLAVKLVYYHVKFLEGVYKDDPLHMLQAQVAWAF
jgi:hypothetical protein